VYTTLHTPSYTTYASKWANADAMELLLAHPQANYYIANKDGAKPRCVCVPYAVSVIRV
jgi:hypothetical protein